MNKDKNLQRGFTLIELSVAIIITSIVITIVYSSWTYWNRYVSRTRSKTELRIEAGRIIKKITNELRKARKILFWDRSRIGFVREDTGDTLVYSYDYNGTIKFNGEEITLLPKGCFVENFSIDNDITTEKDGIYFFSISLTLKNFFNDTINAQKKIMIKAFEEDDDERW